MLKNPFRYPDGVCKVGKGKLIRLLSGLALYAVPLYIREKILKEFKKRGLDVKYSEEIKKWLKYKDEERFKVKLEKQMKDEIDRFIDSRK